MKKDERLPKKYIFFWLKNKTAEPENISDKMIFEEWSKKTPELQKQFLQKYNFAVGETIAEALNIKKR